MASKIPEMIEDIYSRIPIFEPPRETKIGTGLKN